MSTNPRIIRTRTRLRDALVELISERDISAINVQDVTHRAEVNRTTFYLHYTGIEDLLDDTLDQIVRDLDDRARVILGSDADLSVPYLPTGTPSWYTYLGERPAFFYKLCTEPMGASFARKLQKSVEAQFHIIWDRYQLEPEEGAPPADVRATFYAGAVISIVTKWVCDGADPGRIKDYDNWTWSLLIPIWTSRVKNPPPLTSAAPGIFPDVITPVSD